MAFDDRPTVRFVIAALLSMVAAATVPAYQADQHTVATAHASGVTMGLWWHASTMGRVAGIVIVSLAFSLLAIGGVCWVAMRLLSRCRANGVIRGGPSND